MGLGLTTGPFVELLWWPQGLADAPYDDYLHSMNFPQVCSPVLMAQEKRRRN